MSNRGLGGFERAEGAVLAARLREPRRFIQVLAGPRQVGKTTLVRQVLERAGVPARYASADEPTLRGPQWIAQQWDAARLEARDQRCVLVLDEIQKIPGWSESVKRLWDEDSTSGVPLTVVLLGSAPLLVGQGLSESLAGRFEVIRLGHWSYGEMRAAFGFSLDDYLYFGGYPGAAPLKDDPARWRRYVLDSLVETTISRDVLLMTRVDKPALLRRLLDLGSRYSGQILSYNKMLGQLQDAGNATTLAHYLELLSGAGLLLGLPKFAGQAVRQRGSSPKLQVLNTALMTAPSSLDRATFRADASTWGRLVESAVGAHLANAAMAGDFELAYWRDRGREVDFVVRNADRLTAIEVKSGRAPDMLPGVEAFRTAFGQVRSIRVGVGGVSVEEFLSRPARAWLIAQ